MKGPTPFQQRTANYVVRRLWKDNPAARRFLVADEVGLGKTIVAREVIAQTLERFKRRRFDIVYLCSSQAIASQNLKRLKVHGHGGAAKATRLTLLAREGPPGRGPRYFALTPETSFNVTGRSGHVRERALIFWSLRRWIRTPGFEDLLQLVNPWSWERELQALGKMKPDARIVRVFARAVRSDTGLRDAIRALGKDATSGAGDKNFRQARNKLIGRLREMLATASAAALGRNGLIIVDEFQRFSHLLQAPTAASPLAEQLAGNLLSTQEEGRRILLLSATPYRLPGAALVAGERPYDDFVKLARFLAGEEAASRLGSALTEFSQALRARPPDEERVTRARDLAQSILGSVMTRTERTGMTRATDGMIAEDVHVLNVQAGDLRGAIAARKIAKRLKVRDPVEFWKSAPFFLEFMRDYQLHSAAIGSTGPDRAYVGREAKRGNLLLEGEALRRLDELTLPSARMRDLQDDALPVGSEQLLWVPPSLRYLEPAGAFSKAPDDLKRLIFTEWRLAPDAIAALMSYETERRLDMGLRGRKRRGRRPSAREAKRRHEAFDKRGELLRVARKRSDADVTRGVTALALMAPSSTLAGLADPLAMALEQGRPVDPRDALAQARKAAQGALRRLGADYGSGPSDDRWYWAAPLLLDDPRGIDEWLALPEIVAGEKEVGADDSNLLAAMRSFVRARVQLGRRPRNLADVLARQALASPGVCALRALSRAFGVSANSAVVRQAAFHVARGLRALFNQSESTAAVLQQHPNSKRPYWRLVLDYCINGNLQALLDEQMHLEAEALALFDGGEARKIAEAARSVHAALTLRRASLEIGGLQKRRRRTRGGARADSVRLRCRHALRFAEIKEADGAISRLDAVRGAFNSPFRPFLLASTAVGQEGLDFHPWCHAVVHWNLPRSPVELEQREGRVHRYKGHAVRLNVASGIGLAGLRAAGASPSADPWAVLFDLASAMETTNDLAPCWVFEQCPVPRRVKRIVPVLEWSREHDYWPRLRDRLATYRLVMGLPRQDDLLEALDQNGITIEQAREWKIDLAPPPDLPA